MGNTEWESPKANSAYVGKQYIVKTGYVSFRIEVNKKKYMAKVANYFKALFEKKGLLVKTTPVQRLHGENEPYRGTVAYILDITEVNKDALYEILACLTGMAHTVIVSSRKISDIERAIKILKGYRPVKDEAGNVVKFSRIAKNIVIKESPISTTSKKIYGGKSVQFYYVKMMVSATNKELATVKELINQYVGKDMVSIGEASCKIGDITVKMPPYTKIKSIKMVKQSQVIYGTKPPTPVKNTTKTPKQTTEAELERMMHERTLMAVSNELDKLNKFTSSLFTAISEKKGIVRYSAVEQCNAMHTYRRAMPSVKESVDIEAKPFTDIHVTFVLPGNPKEPVPKPTVEYTHVDLKNRFRDIGALMTRYPELEKLAMHGVGLDTLEKEKPNLYKVVRRAMLDEQYTKFVNTARVYMHNASLYVAIVPENKNTRQARCKVILGDKIIPPSGNNGVVAPATLDRVFLEIPPGSTSNRYTLIMVTSQYVVDVTEEGVYYRLIAQIWANDAVEKLLKNLMYHNKEKIMVINGFTYKKDKNCKTISGNIPTL